MDRLLLHRQDKQHGVIRSYQLDVCLVRVRDCLLRFPVRRQVAALPQRATSQTVPNWREQMVHPRLDAPGAHCPSDRHLPLPRLAIPRHEILPIGRDRGGHWDLPRDPGTSTAARPG